MLYAYGAMEALHIYQTIPDMIPIVIFEGSELDNCINRSPSHIDDTENDATPGYWQPRDRIGCIKKRGYEEGIPIWK